MSRPETIRLAVAQPRAFWGDEAARNLDEALRLVEQAGALGVDLLLFPETYPGPYSESLRYEVLGPLSEAAARHRLALVAGTTEETEPGSGDYFIEAVVIGTEGEVKGRYRRTHPAGTYLYEGGAFWDVAYEAANELPVFDMGWGKLGINICSEVYVPELARALALQGAEICAFPTGLLIDELGYLENWRTLIRARAIENLMYTATTVHLFPPEFVALCAAGGEFSADALTTGSGLTAGHAMIASPERVLAATHEPGLLTADLDLERLRRMRKTVEELSVPAPFRTIPGVLDWRRPEVFAELLARSGALAQSGA